MDAKICGVKDPKTLDYIINITNPSIFQSVVNYSVEKTLKTIRVFR